jgi:hypothetical protein
MPSRVENLAGPLDRTENPILDGQRVIPMVFGKRLTLLVTHARASQGRVPSQVPFPLGHGIQITPARSLPQPSINVLAD